MTRLVVLVAACGSTASTIRNEHVGEVLTIGERGMGVIDATTHVTLASMRALFPSYEVTADAGEGNTTYNVMTKGDKLLYVLANDDGSVFRVQATSAAIASSSHDWRVGGKLRGGVIDGCDCWGLPGDDVATCFKTGEHVAVVIERPCDGKLTTPQQREQLVGATIARIVWQPKPWHATDGTSEGM